MAMTNVRIDMETTLYEQMAALCAKLGTTVEATAVRYRSTAASRSCSDCRDHTSKSALLIVIDATLVKAIQSKNNDRIHKFICEGADVCASLRKLQREEKQ